MKGLFSLNNKKKKLEKKNRKINFFHFHSNEKIFAYGNYSYYRRKEASHQEVTDICKQ